MRLQKIVIPGFLLIVGTAIITDRHYAQLSPLVADSFTRPDGLITNEWAFNHPTDPRAVHDSKWEMTSGSLFASGNMGWTGVLTRGAPNYDSTNFNDSPVFRLITRRDDVYNAEVSFKLLNMGMTSFPDLPPVATDGMHVQLRYLSQYNLYAVSVNRRDNTVIIKKKIPGGPSNGGTYYNVSPYRTFNIPYNQWQTVRVTIEDQLDGSVAIQAFVNGIMVVGAVDNGSVGGPPIRGSGKIGIRGDNTEFKIDDFSVTELGGTPPPVPPPGSPAPVAAELDLKARERFLSPGLSDGVNDVALFGSDADEVVIYDVHGRRIFKAERQGASRVSWNGRDESGRVVSSGVYIARIRHGAQRPVYQSFAVAK